MIEAQMTNVLTLKIQDLLNDGVLFADMHGSLLYDPLVACALVHS